MKIFSWMQNKFNGKGSNNRPNPDPTSNHMMYQAPKEEFSDWPNTLLTIGTFGLKESNKANIQGISPSKQDHVERSTTSDEYVELDKMLRQILMNKQVYIESDKHYSMSLEKSFLDCSGENERTAEELKESQYQRNVSLIHREENDIQSSDSKICGIRKKSLTFLLKKALLCRGGFTANPGLRDPYPLSDVKLERSRMEKVFRAMLNKKIYPQKSNPKSASRKYLDRAESCDDDDETGDRLMKNKWDKTDSEYIVLEI